MGTVNGPIDDPAGDASSSNRLLLAGGLAAAGHVVHNVAEFPLAILVAPETLVPVAITAGLVAWLYYRPSRVAAGVLAAWALLTILGGGTSVFPFAFLPFEPEQTVSHYAVHAVYAAFQVPVLVASTRIFRSR